MSSEIKCKIVTVRICNASDQHQDDHHGGYRGKQLLIEGTGKTPRRESGRRGVVSLLPTVATPFCVGVLVKPQ